MTVACSVSISTWTGCSKTSKLNPGLSAQTFTSNFSTVFGVEHVFPDICGSIELLFFKIFKTTAGEMLTKTVGYISSGSVLIILVNFLGTAHLGLFPLAMLAKAIVFFNS